MEMQISFKHRALGNLPERAMEKHGILKADNSPQGRLDRRYSLTVKPGEEHRAQETADHLHRNGVIELDLVLEGCGCCGCYHPKGFTGECRENETRYPTDNPADKYEASCQEWDVCMMVGEHVRILGSLKAHTEQIALKYGKKWYGGNNVADRDDIFVSLVGYEVIQVPQRVRFNAHGVKTFV